MEILMLQALTQHAHGDAPGAIKTLERALVLAEPEGYVRLFVDEGPSMAVLLYLLLARWQATRGTDYLRKLLTALEAEHLKPGPAPSPSPTAPALVSLDVLSQRERQVLRLLAAGLSNPEIADELVVSLNTIKTQVQSIYRKLNATNRKEARAIAQQLKLI
jgi:LuxR family maltose regulon positive regulatory protein